MDAKRWSICLHLEEGPIGEDYGSALPSIGRDKTPDRLPFYTIPADGQARKDDVEWDGDGMVVGGNAPFRLYGTS